MPIRIETAGDHNLIGSNIKGNSVSAKIGGNQTITSVQDTSEMDHTRGNWSASVGVAITTDGIIQGTASASASGGKDFDNSKLTAEQAGISADNLDLKVAGNLNLTGAHITSKPGQGSVDVGGNITAQTLQDSRNKDGGYAGGGGGISKNGLPSVTLEFGRVDQVHYIAENAATIDVGDPSKVSAAGGISGPLNTDANKQLSVLQNKRVAGTDVKVEISIGDAQEIVAGVKKLFTPKAGRNVHLADAPRTQTRQGDSNTTKTVEVDVPKATLRSYTDIDAPKVKQTFDQRVVVNTDTTDPVVNKAVQNLASKHPDNTVVVTPTADGGHKVLSGALADSGSKKVEVVGHSDGLKLGGMDSKQITDVVQQLTQNGNSSVDKVALVGCGTACAKNGASLVSEVSGLLQQAAATKVKGYDTPVMVDDQGRKQPVVADAAGALGKDDQLPASPPKQAAEHSSTENEVAVRPAESAIWKAERDDIISHDTASYLDALHSKVSELLIDGPVLIGEEHSEENSRILIQQLIAENKLSRVVIELPPLEMLSEFADLDTTKQALREIGFESIDDYFSGFTEDQRHTDFYNQAQRSVLESLEEAVEGPQLQIMTEAIKAGLHVDFIDGGRYMDDDVIDNLDELSVRNAYMTKKLSGEKKYSEPGVLGLFGLEHSRTYAGTDGTLQPAMQQTLNFPQNRVHETFALYHDHTTGEYFFPWSHLGAMANQTAEMSLSFPYKKTAADQQYKARTNKSHVIIDASDGAADERIKRIVEQRPSTSIIFKPSDTHGLEYISGTRLNIDHLPTKAYLFGNENSDSSKLDRLLSHAALKLDADLADISVKKIYVGSPQTPVEEGSQRGSKSIQVNSDVIHSSNKHPQEEGTNKTATISQPSAGKDRATVPDPLTLAPPSGRSHAADFIAEARAEQMISPESKEYLDQVKLVISEQLNTGPVLLGEYHLLPEALLLTKQLISEDRVKRLVLESPPLSELLHDQEAANISHYMATKKISSTGELVATLPELGDSSDHLERVLHWQEKIKPFADELKSSGWASLDTYLANFQPSDAASERFRQAQYLFNEATAAAGNDEYNQLASHAISSGTQIAFVDGGRTRNEYTDNGSIAVYDGDSFHLRNLDMANRIKPDGDEIAAGTLGLFGLDHLKTSVSNQGTLNPALQELLNIPEDRVHQLMPMFTDLQSGKEYFPSLIQPRASHAGASITHPFKLLPEYNQQNGEQRLYQERKNRSHVIVNLVGDKAASEIAGLQDAHPSSNITFSGDRKGLRYESGIAVNFSSDIKTKVYILSDPAKPTLSTEFVLSQLGEMLGRDEKNFKVKEGLLESDSDSGADTPL